MLFISSQKLFPFLRYLNFCSDFFVHVVKQLHKKAKVNFNVYHTTTWERNTRIAQHLRK